MYISPQPTIRLKDFLDKEHVVTQDCSGVFTVDGRSALSSGLRLLGISKNDTILIPAYICKIVPIVLNEMDIPYRYYYLKYDLAIDKEKLIELMNLEESSAILIMHYFGFVDPQLDEIIKLARKKKIKIIEDCVHALFSKNKDRFVGQDGHIAVYSLRKSLGLPTGGMLRINFKHNNSVELNRIPFFKIILTTIKYLLYMVERKIGFSLRPYLLSIKPIRGFVRGEKKGRISNEYKMDEMSLKIFMNTDSIKHVAKHRENFTYMGERAKAIGIVPLYKSLPKGICPFGFPVVLEGRDEIQKKLYQRGLIINALWDELPEDLSEYEFPVSHYLKQRLLVLPVHSDIGKEEIDYLMKVIAENTSPGEGSF